MSGQPQLSFARRSLLALSFVIGLGAGFARANHRAYAQVELTRRLRA